MSPLDPPPPPVPEEAGDRLERQVALRCWASDYGLKAATLLMARLLEVFPA
jgi:hypothetical protein